MTSTTYTAIDEALADIAGRSFYESALVHKVDGGYAVNDHYTGVDELLPWSYEDGLTLPDGVLDHSRLHESYETYTEAGHVRYNLPGAVEAIENGEAVGFTYVIGEAECEDDPDGTLYPDGCPFDHAAGWALIATRETAR